jgi:hypothetical protein
VSSPKGLATGKVGTFSDAVLGISSVAPGYTLTASIGLIVAAVVLLDTIAALGIMICWYFGITAFACVWYFRKELFSSVHNVAFKFLFPLLGGIILATVFVISAGESMNPENASGGSIFGIGLVFYMGFGILLLGAVLMVVWRFRSPGFFEGRTLARTRSDRAPVG